MQNFEDVFVQKIARMEDLIAKKATVYSRLLTDTALAETMSQIANRRQQNASAWYQLITAESCQVNNRGDNNEV